jgi:acyl dehydratase
MTINPDLQGRSYPAAEVYDVGREKIREFARAVKATHPAHFDVDAARALGHGDQRFVHHRPIVAGDRLVAELHVDGVRAMGGGAMITTRSEIFALAGDEAGSSSAGQPGTGAREAVATTTSSILVRGEGQ